MKRISVATVLAVLPLLAGGGAARASGDGCEPGWSLDFASKPLCANVSALVPGNDTRANLLLMLKDRFSEPAPTDPVERATLDWPDFRDRFEGVKPGPEPYDYADGEGSRCRSIDPGAKGFEAAIGAAEGLSPEERGALIGARAKAMFNCSSPDAAAAAAPGVPAPANLDGAPAKAFLSYLLAADAFYAGRFEEAGRWFADLAKVPDPWLSETAAYMVGRNLVNWIQVGAFDQYGVFQGAKAVDQARAGEARDSLEAYLARYPNGRYSASAKGLLRRVDWLAGWTDRLAARYSALMSLPPKARGLTDGALVEEIDNKLLPTLKPEDTRDPLLLAMLDLRALRKPDPGEARIPLPDLGAQAAAFGPAPDLYAFLQGAYAFYDQGDAKAVLKGVPDDARRKGGDHLWFSRQFLRGTALDAAGDRNARGFWKELAGATSRPLDRSAAELAVALDDERRRDVADAFAAGSVVTDPAIRTILLTRSAGPDLLRGVASDVRSPQRERQVALFTLLRKELTRGDYASFLQNLRSVPQGADAKGDVDIDPLGGGAVPLGVFTAGDTSGQIQCPGLPDTVGALVRAPAATRPKLCLAEFMDLNGFDPNRYASPPGKNALGHFAPEFPGREVSRQSLYADVIADPNAPAADRSYALFRAVKCYESSGENHCGGKDVPKAQRHKWYDTLKADYPNSKWALDLRYWW